MEPCVANIGPRQRRRRLVSGLLGLAVAVGAAVALRDATLPLRALVFLPLLGAAWGVFQYLEKT